MRILVGVVGVGLGHATRSAVVIEHLLSGGHEVRVVSYGKALDVLRQRFGGHAAFSSRRIEGLGLHYDDQGAVDLGRSIASLVGRAPGRLAANLETWLVRMTDFHADVVVSDFDSWSWTWGQAHGVPVIAIDNLQALVRCAHPRDLVRDPASFALARAAIRAKLPGPAFHYLVPTFFRPRVRRGRTTLVPPILRPAVADAVREPGEHVLVYQSVWSDALLEAVAALPVEVRAYGADRTGTDGNVTWRPFSEDGFVDDLRTARAVVAGGGFSLMSEAVHLGVPMLSVPLRGQVEQELNAAWLARLGYGAKALRLDGDVLRAFLDRTDDHAAALARRPPEDPATALLWLDVLLWRLGSARLAA